MLKSFLLFLNFRGIRFSDCLNRLAMQAVKDDECSHIIDSAPLRRIKTLGLNFLGWHIGTQEVTMPPFEIVSDFGMTGDQPYL